MDTQKLCGVSVLRAGETMEGALCEVCKDIRLGKILIQTNLETTEPEVHQPCQVEFVKNESEKKRSFERQKISRLQAVVEKFHLDVFLFQQLHYLRLPKDIKENFVMVLDATVATGAAAMMAIRVLLDHDVPEENIMLLSLIMAESGIALSFVLCCESIFWQVVKIKIVVLWIGHLKEMVID